MAQLVSVVVVVWCRRMAWMTILVWALAVVVNGARFPYVAPSAIYGFTDSFSDVGNLKITQPDIAAAANAPYGKSIHKVTGRFSDGYLIIDFLAQHVGYDQETASQSQSSPTFDSLCFGVAGATVGPQQLIPDTLPKQVQQFKDYKNAILRDNPDAGNDFLNSLYYIQIGVNDISSAFFSANNSFNDVKSKVVPQVVEGLIDSIESLYKDGAVNFLIFNIPVIGCSPVYITNFNDGTWDVSSDEHGCVAEANDVFQYFNDKFYSAIKDLRDKYPAGNFIYFDFYKANIHLLNEPDKYKITEPIKACCGSGGDYNCAKGETVCGCGTTDKTGCKNPYEHYSWDGIHYTQKFYELIFNAIITGAYMDPPTRILNPSFV